ncbi:MAG: hypothetical protein IJL66_01120 [Lachnospiraceae bacterium]|nr:hypothetical protein [Lachnospiraceae bacterium]
MAQSNRKQSMERLQQRHKKKERPQDKIDRKIVTARDLFLDLALILILSITFWFTMRMNAGAVSAILQNPERSLLVRSAVLCLFQAGMAGLAALYVMFHRYETVRDHGVFWGEKTPLALGLSVLCFVPVLLVRIMEGGFSVSPFKRVPLMDEVAANTDGTAAVVMALVFLVFGLVQGLAYVVFADKVNAKFPKRIASLSWLSWGALAGAALFVWMSSVWIGFIPSVASGIAAFLMMFGLLTVRDLTGCSWGVIGVILLLWNMC